MIRVERNQFAKTIAAIPLCLVLSSFSLLSEPEKIDVISLFIHHLFGTMSLDTHGTFLLVMENMLFLLLFQLLFADHISRHVRLGGVYILSRVQSRNRWYFSRILELTGYASLYVLFYFLTLLWVSARRSTLPVNMSQFSMVVLLWMLSVLLAIQISTITNLAALYRGTAVAVFAVMCGFVILIMHAVIGNSIPAMRWLNPMACLGLLYAPTYQQVWMITYHVLLTIITQLVGAQIIQHYDIALFDAETK